MNTPRPAMSNTERQRKFRQSHPGYYARLSSRRRDIYKRSAEAWKAAALAQAEAARAQAVQREPLMLPAPVEQILIPGMNAIPTSLNVREAVAVVSESQTR